MRRSKILLLENALFSYSLMATSSRILLTGVFVSRCKRFRMQAGKNNWGMVKYITRVERRIKETILAVCSILPFSAHSSAVSSTSSLSDKEDPSRLNFWNAEMTNESHEFNVNTFAPLSRLLYFFVNRMLGDNMSEFWKNIIERARFYERMERKEMEFHH